MPLGADETSIKPRCHGRSRERFITTPSKYVDELFYFQRVSDNQFKFLNSSNSSI